MSHEEYREILISALGITEEEGDAFMNDSINYIVEKFYLDQGIVDDLSFDNFMITFTGWVDEANLQTDKLKQKEQIQPKVVLGKPVTPEKIPPKPL